MNNNLKSNEALKAYAREVLCGNNPTNSLLIRMFDEIIDNAPAVEIATKLQPNCNNLQQPQGDSISRKYLKEQIPKLWSHDDAIDIWIKKFDVEDLIDNAPGQWIPITFREADDDEYKEFLKRYDDIPREECKVYDCRMPDDGQEVLVTTCGGYVCEDVFCADPDAYGFENCSDPGDAIAWMPKPEPYKKEGTENG